MADPFFGSTFGQFTPQSSHNIVVDTTANGFQDRRMYMLNSDTQRAVSDLFGPFTPAFNAGYMENAFSGTNGYSVLELFTSGGQMGFKVTGEDGSNHDRRLHYWNGSTFVVVGTADNIGQTTKNIYLSVTGLGTTSGSITMTILRQSDNTVWTVSGTGLNFSSIANIAQAKCGTPHSGGNSGQVFGNFYIRETGGGISTELHNRRPNADGTDVDGTGGYTLVNENAEASGTSVLDFSTLTTAGQKRSYKSGARAVETGRGVIAVSPGFLMRKGASGVGTVRFYLRIGGVKYDHPTTQVLTESFTAYARAWPLNPATGAAWTVAQANDANLEYGIEVVS